MSRIVKADTFGVRLKQSREQAGMTQAELARSVGYKDRNAVWQWEHDNQMPPLSTFPLLAEALGVDMCWLAFGEQRQGGLKGLATGEEK